jgi:hypothetical protein
MRFPLWQQGPFCKIQASYGLITLLLHESIDFLIIDSLFFKHTENFQVWRSEICFFQTLTTVAEHEALLKLKL